jgi:hypothetical protein
MSQNAQALNGVTTQPRDRWGRFLKALLWALSAVAV